jgi:IS30 family transposase
MIRFVIPKGYTLDGLTQDKVDEIMSNVNSYARDSLNWKKPVELMRQAFSDELLQKWRIREIPSSEVNLRSIF